jgi:hypothetical protein
LSRRATARAAHPGALDDASTIMLRVKGSDLMAYRSNQITKEEARKKVEVREF